MRLRTSGVPTSSLACMSGSYKICRTRNKRSTEMAGRFSPRWRNATDPFTQSSFETLGSRSCTYVRFYCCIAAEESRTTRTSFSCTRTYDWTFYRYVLYSSTVLRTPTPYSTPVPDTPATGTMIRVESPVSRLEYLIRCVFYSCFLHQHAGDTPLHPRSLCRGLLAEQILCFSARLFCVYEFRVRRTVGYRIRDCLLPPLLLWI